MCDEGIDLLRNRQERSNIGPSAGQGGMSKRCCIHLWRRVSSTRVKLRLLYILADEIINAGHIGREP